MSEMSFEELLKQEEMLSIYNGQLVEGTVIDVKEDEIVLNINYKADGIITRREYSNSLDVNLKDVVKVGDTMQAKVLKVNDGEGQVLLTYKRIAMDKANKKLEEAFNSKEVLKGKVSKVQSGGLSVDFEESTVFIPASLVSDVFEKDLNKYLGMEVEFVITEYNAKRRRIIGDRKQLLVAKKNAQKNALLEKISEGSVIEGTVKNVTDFGAFIDLGGVDGLLHISEMSWGRVDNPKKTYKVGDVVKAFVKEIKGEKIALSMKFDDENPWAVAATKYAVGTVVEGKVARMTEFGAFVELEAGIDALLHVSQISLEHTNVPADVLKIGDIINAKVVDFNLEDKKISLSIKALELDKKEAEEAEDIVVAEEQTEISEDVAE
ncbi:MAG: 30S ribosomal protein S1 [Lachnospiraceae bacterium]|nr:30S ribosomal protein S1 [Lachnospiraceae bacterium]